jgi:hypothetical protein
MAFLLSASCRFFYLRVGAALTSTLLEPDAERARRESHVA